VVLYQYAVFRIMVIKEVDNIVHEGKFLFQFHPNETDVSEIRDVKSRVIMNKETLNIFFSKMENLGSECSLLS
jgi:hypothetical protein